LTPSPVIEVKDVSFSYDGPLVLEHIDLTIDRGEFLGLVGPNGGGKSTLLKIILGLLQPVTGSVTVLGRSPKQGRRDIGYVPQFTVFSRDFPISVEDTVLLGRLGKTRRWGGYRGKDREVAQRVMHETELFNLRHRRLSTLSGGQLQRVLIARALACEPEVLILDEPTANIDFRSEKDIFDLLKHLSEKPTIIVVSHDIGFISQYVNRVACLNRTLVCHQTGAINGEIIKELYAAPVRMIRHIH
jgi:zinc transport system ATP-binding protein